MPLVSLDEQPALVVGGEVHRADHPVATTVAQPRLGRPEQRACNLGVVLGLEETEKPPVVALELVEVPSMWALIRPTGSPSRQARKYSRLRMLEEWVLGRGRGTALALRDQRRDPVRLVTIEPPRQLDEPSRSRRDATGLTSRSRRGTLAHNGRYLATPLLDLFEKARSHDRRELIEHGA